MVTVASQKEFMQPLELFLGKVSLSNSWMKSIYLLRRLPCSCMILVCLTGPVHAKFSLLQLVDHALCCWSHAHWICGSSQWTQFDFIFPCCVSECESNMDDTSCCCQGLTSFLGHHTHIQAWLRQSCELSFSHLIYVLQLAVVISPYSL